MIDDVIVYASAAVAIFFAGRLWELWAQSRHGIKTTMRSQKEEK